MNCYLWELEAILEGLALKKIDEKEQNAIFAFNLRYVLNDKKPKLKKVFDKMKAETKIKNIFGRNKIEQQNKTQNVKQVMDYFKNKKWG
ncbi:hypothetical protein CUM50_08390 [Enterococcus faecium]|nr:hypothetical protein CDL00_04225 [Enterococcus faecium]EGP5343685.1 hypothetical protein [Enterococcus faecium]EGP5362795.1 hypothetical protein [Enterococcus faecium]EGP5512079.1 hypothetical protein [Enterococcus faecium]EGP5671223.1 hypothetical protein [Enterococcus faecium]